MSFYGCFLVTSNATTVMPTMKTMIIATTAYMTVVFEAKSLTGEILSGQMLMVVKAGIEES